MSTQRRNLAVLLIGIAGLWLLLVWLASALTELSAIYHPDVYQEYR